MHLPLAVLLCGAVLVPHIYLTMYMEVFLLICEVVAAFSLDQ